jgi:hypothetical protein
MDASDDNIFMSIRFEKMVHFLVFFFNFKLMEMIEWKASLNNQCIIFKSIVFKLDSLSLTYAMTFFCQVILV